MKRINLFCALLLIAGAFGQVLAYEPVVKENKQWVYYKMSIRSKQFQPGSEIVTDTIFFPCVYEFKGDTVVDGITYLKLWRDYKYLKPSFSASPTFYDPEPQREYGVIMLARDENTTTKARRVGSDKPLVGLYRNGYKQLHDDLGPEYDTYCMGWRVKAQQKWYDQVRLTRKERDELFTFSDDDYITVNGTQRLRIISSFPNRYLIEGIGYVKMDFDLGATPTNFIDLEDGGYYLLFSHLIEDGEIVFKSDWCDFIRESGKIYDPDAPQGGGDEPSGVGEVPVDGGASVDGRTYDMQGRVVSDPSAPGIYVRDGQKILVK